MKGRPFILAVLLACLVLPRAALSQDGKSP